MYLYFILTSMEIAKPKRNHSLNYVIFIQSLVAMLGSLYFSNFGDPVGNIQKWTFFHGDGWYNPCNLCWWSRILMYPIVWISLWALIRQDRKVVSLIQWISWAGILLSTYHYLQQKTTLFQGSVFCTLENACSNSQLGYLGFMTIPMMALIAYIVIFICCMVVKSDTPKEIELEHHTF